MQLEEGSLNMYVDVYEEKICLQPSPTMPKAVEVFIWRLSAVPDNCDVE